MVHLCQLKRGFEPFESLSSDLKQDISFHCIDGVYKGVSSLLLPASAFLRDITTYKKQTPTGECFCLDPDVEISAPQLTRGQMGLLSEFLRTGSLKIPRIDVIKFKKVAECLRIDLFKCSELDVVKIYTLNKDGTSDVGEVADNQEPPPVGDDHENNIMDTNQPVIVDVYSIGNKGPTEVTANAPAPEEDDTAENRDQGKEVTEDMITEEEATDSDHSNEKNTDAMQTCFADLRKSASMENCPNSKKKLMFPPTQQRISSMQKATKKRYCQQCDHFLPLLQFKEHIITKHRKASRNVVSLESKVTEGKVTPMILDFPLGIKNPKKGGNQTTFDYICRHCKFSCLYLRPFKAHILNDCTRAAEVDLQCPVAGCAFTVPGPGTSKPDQVDRLTRHLKSVHQLVSRPGRPGKSHIQVKSNHTRMIREGPEKAI